MFSKLTLLVLLCGLFYSSHTVAEPVRLNQDEGLKGKFTQQRYLEGFERPIESSGEFYVVPNVGLIWQTQAPIASRMEIDKNGISQSIRGGEVTRISLEQFPSLEILKEALEQSLAGNWEYLESLAGKELVKSGDIWSLEYEPGANGADLAFEKIAFEIGNYLDQVEVIKKNGDRDIITFSDQTHLPKEIVLKEFNNKVEADQ
ncbi:MAG: outer membrane lipoprotein carrier protein LolA [Proteobacteria bacterium]|nr:outer membrane lipoprotein carrier protein LolA [Pseudomonadota bacterium]